MENLGVVISSQHSGPTWTVNEGWWRWTVPEESM
jgi:hypothetical protein